MSNISYLDFCFGIELVAAVDLTLDIKLLSEESKNHLVKSRVAETQPRRQTGQQCIVAQGKIRMVGKSRDKLKRSKTAHCNNDTLVQNKKPYRGQMGFFLVRDTHRNRFAWLETIKTKALSPEIRQFILSRLQHAQDVLQCVLTNITQSKRG